MFKIYFKIHRSMLHKGQYRLNFEDFEVDQARRGGGGKLPWAPGHWGPQFEKRKNKQTKEKN
jgi:hypothetical protein